MLELWGMRNTYRIYAPIFFKMAVDDRVQQKILENRIHDSLVSETKGGDVGKLISFGNLLDREITCLVLPTTSVHLILSRAK